jgi:hypothetical protein
MSRRIIALAAAVALAVLGVTAWMAGGADAATPACTAVVGNACGSWNAEVPGLPDLDVLGTSAVSGNSIIVFTRTSHDKAEDFAVQVVAPAAVSKYTVAGVHSFTVGVTTPPVNAVAIRYTPFGVDSGLCVSTVNPDGFAAAQLRPCSNNLTQFNPFQTFVSSAADGDGTFVQFTEVINSNVMTDPANGGSIGTIGHRVHVTFTANHHFTGQLWGQNGT